MNSDEKMNEVKKAYANMILNVTKEAAARVMVSERKAARLEEEMKRSKDEAVFMLMRLKQMMDAKDMVSEAEMASRAQVKKVDELEAQIHEAEDIVIDLREELSSVQRQLARASQKEEVKRMVQVDEGWKENIFSCPNSFICPPPDKQQKFFPDSGKDTSNIGQKLYKPLFPSLRSYYKDMDLPAIISRSQGTKHYRSGCTQRILACEQKNLIHDDLTTKVGESHNPGNEMRKIKTIASPNKKQKISSPNHKKDRAADSSSLTTTRLVNFLIRQRFDKGSNIVMGCVRVIDCFNLIRPELQPLEHEMSELPLDIEAQLDPPEEKALETDGVPIKPLLTFQKRWKQETVSTDGKNVSNNCKLKNTKDDKNAVLETEKVNSIQESAHEETEEVVSVEKSAKEEIPLELIAYQVGAIFTSLHV
ncbi:hypothetical protein CTI12_AA338450 [Artemisia annua]|uniref:Uncharacterized protein n=1 Tax=Artemisia annua TaxID=35608 RepID=A0A2U1MVJ2_ARTAN|nr:hypothetical protein CTI12_AA338450 [Artemisia annua]